VKVLVLGATGMLGSMVLDYFKRHTNYTLAATVRGKNVPNEVRQVEFLPLDASTASVDELSALLSDVDWVINCIGVIKPYIKDNNPVEVANAVRINSLFPHNLANAVGNTSARVLQIATDCVYSGKIGFYKETDNHDAEDVYGRSKSLGEPQVQRFHNLRVSIIGPEKKVHSSLLDWFLSHPKGATVKGYANHTWNGITTLHFAKLCLGIIENNTELSNLQHVVPANALNKYQMLQCFKSCYGREDLKIEEFETPQPIHRTLATDGASANEQLWSRAGYEKVPTIETMVEEMAGYSLNKDNEKVKKKNAAA